MGCVADIVERLTGRKPDPIYVKVAWDDFVWEWDPQDEYPKARSIMNREAEAVSAICAIQRHVEEMRAKAKPIEEAAKAYFGERYKAQ